MTTASELAQQLRNEIERSTAVMHRIAAQLDAMGDAQPVMVKVPYRSQHDDDAKISRADCGPACVAMVLEWRGLTVTTDDLTRMTSMGATNAGQLIAAAGQHGLKLHRRAPMTIFDLENQIRLGNPFIALIRYTDFGSIRQDLAYTGLHWVVVVGFDVDSVYVNDPDYWGARRLEGRGRAIPRHLFERAWGNTLPDAMAYQGLVMDDSAGRI